MTSQIFAFNDDLSFSSHCDLRNSGVRLWFFLVEERVAELQEIFLGQPNSNNLRIYKTISPINGQFRISLRALNERWTIDGHAEFARRAVALGLCHIKSSLLFVSKILRWSSDKQTNYTVRLNREYLPNTWQYHEYSSSKARKSTIKIRSVKNLDTQLTNSLFNLLAIYKYRDRNHSLFTKSGRGYLLLSVYHDSAAVKIPHVPLKTPHSPRSAEFPSCSLREIAH